MPFPIAFARLKALQAAVRHPHNDNTNGDNEDGNAIGGLLGKNDDCHNDGTKEVGGGNNDDYTTTGSDCSPQGRGPNRQQLCHSHPEGALLADTAWRGGKAKKIEKLGNSTASGNSGLVLQGRQ